MEDISAVFKKKSGGCLRVDLSNWVQMFELIFEDLKRDCSIGRDAKIRFGLVF
jgi:hypothetical protein